MLCAAAAAVVAQKIRRYTHECCIYTYSSTSRTFGRRNYEAWILVKLRVGVTNAGSYGPRIFGRWISTRRGLYVRMYGEKYRSVIVHPTYKRRYSSNTNTADEANVRGSRGRRVVKEPSGHVHARRLVSASSASSSSSRVVRRISYHREEQSSFFFSIENEECIVS